MYHSMRKSMAAARKHAFVRNACGHYLDGSRARTTVLVITGSHEKCYPSNGPLHASPQPLVGDAASHRRFGRPSRFCACSARRCGKAWPRIATTRSSDHRALRTIRRCDSRSHSLPRPRARDARRSRRCGLRARHRPPFALLAMGGRGKRPCAMPRLDLAAGISAGRGRRGAVSTSTCRADGGPRRLRPEATR